MIFGAEGRTRTGTVCDRLIMRFALHAFSKLFHLGEQPLLFPLRRKIFLILRVVGDHVFQ